MTAVARASALMLHIDAIVILLPMCRSFISLLRRSPLNDLIPSVAVIVSRTRSRISLSSRSDIVPIRRTGSRGVSTSIRRSAGRLLFGRSSTLSPVRKALLSLRPTASTRQPLTRSFYFADTINFARLASSSSTGFGGFLRANFVTGPGLTGWVMAGTLGTMVWFALERNRRRPNGGYERFWYTHHVCSFPSPCVAAALRCSLRNPWSGWICIALCCLFRGLAAPRHV